VRVKVFGGPSTGNVSYHDPRANPIVTIGRSQNNNIPINDPVLSKK